MDARLEDPTDAAESTTDDARGRAASAPRITPRISAAEAYPQMERALVAARREVVLSFRVLDTRTGLLTTEAKNHADGTDWASLIAAVAARGVRVRFQTSDFDPIGGAELHRSTWASIRHLAKALESRPGAAANVEMIAARHPMMLGAVWRALFAPYALKELKDVRQRVDAGKDVHDEYPSLRSVTSGALPRLFPATHHQKIAVFDGVRAFIGGLDVDARRWDTVEHRRPAGETWRDVTVEVTGPAAAAVEATAARIWTRAAADYADRDDLPEVAATFARPQEWRPAPVEQIDAPGAPIVVMTESEARDGPFAFAPRTTRDEILRSAVKLIGDAKRFIYIETQFLRCQTIAAMLAKAATDNPDLQLVIVLPFAPERFAFEKRRDKAMRHGEWLQLKALDKLRMAFGDRLAVLSPAKPCPADDDDDFVAFGAGIVYVHSKVLLIDGEWAMIGSANMNGRSLQWDTEAALIWKDNRSVDEFLRRVAATWAAGEIENPYSAQSWADAAARNAAAPPAARIGFLLPHDFKRPRWFARRSLMLPDALF